MTGGHVERTPAGRSDTNVSVYACHAGGLHAGPFQQRFTEVNDGLIRKDPSPQALEPSQHARGTSSESTAFSHNHLPSQELVAHGKTFLLPFSS